MFMQEIAQTVINDMRLGASLTHGSLSDPYDLIEISGKEV